MSMLTLAVSFLGIDADLAKINGDRDMVEVGEYFDNPKATSAHESGAERNLGANARSWESPDHDDSNAVRRIGNRGSGVDSWR